MCSFINFFQEAFILFFIMIRLFWEASWETQQRIWFSLDFERFLSVRELKNYRMRASLVAQWLRVRLPMQGTRVRVLGWEDPTCRRATRPVRHNCWACALGAVSHNYWSPRATATEAHTPRDHAPQQEKPLQSEACTLPRRGAPARHN